MSRINNNMDLKDNNNSGATGGIGDAGITYPNDVILNSGVKFNVRYIGCIEVKTSMKILDFNTRSQVARECINRVCETAGLRASMKRKIDKKVLQCISDRPCMVNSGTNVIINISSKALNLENNIGEIIAYHDMPKISFASGGDSETLDFLAYVAKNEEGWRACYVLECGGGQTQNVISTIGKAFMLRFKAINKPNQNDNFNNEKDYYNDLPGKLPPDFLIENDNPKKNITHLNITRPRERLSSNLIDLNSPPADSINKKHLDLNLCIDNHYMSKGPHSFITNANDDVFDIHTHSLSAEVQHSQLLAEAWFHSVVSRPVAESLLQNDGDFLVRESQAKPGQYVLTALEGTQAKHLILIDPNGIVRTKDRIFESISHLINYHWVNSLPIISEETELILRNPIIKTS